MELEKYMDALGSTAPAPGGGSASAVSAMLGLSLLEKAVRLTMNKKQFVDHMETYEKALSQWEEAKQVLKEVMADDERAFEAVIAVYRLKPTEEEKDAHLEKMDEALEFAGMVPLRGGKVMVQSLETAQTVSTILNPWVISDLISGMEMVFNGVKTILLNTAINVDGMRRGEKRETLRREMNATYDAAKIAHQKLANTVYPESMFSELQ